MRLIIVLSILVAIVSLQPKYDPEMEETVTYENPLAYVGADGVYITSLDAKTKTLIFKGNGQATTSKGDTQSITGINWSPNGSQFVFAAESNLYIVSSGKQPERLTDVYIGQPISAWSPDSTQIAFFDAEPPHHDGNIRVISLLGGSSYILGPASTRGIGDGAYILDEANLFVTETAQEYWLGNRKLWWTTQGVISESDSVTQIYDLDGSIVNENPSGRWLSPDQKWEIDFKKDENSSWCVLRETSTGKETKLPISPMYNIVDTIWIPDSQSILYTTITGRHTVNVWSETAGYEYNAIEGVVSLNQLPLNTMQPIELYRRKGYSIGKITVSPDSSIAVFSFITSSMDVVKAFLNDVPTDTLNQISGAHIELIMLPLAGNNRNPTLLGYDRNPAFGKGKFVAVGEHQPK